MKISQNSFLTGLVLAALVTATPSITAGFNPEVLNSVVSVLPDWSTDDGAVEPTQRSTKGPEGTAVAIFPGGYMATNAHVLGRAETASIRLHDGRILPVEIIAKDQATDLALLKAPINFPLMKLSYGMPLGSPVCAVGNQFGLGLSVTCGVVSATRRTATGFNPIEDFIQTDAVVNPGGSGGALVNESGHLVGLVSAIFTKNNNSNIGVNFATSSALLIRVLEDLKVHGHVQRVRSGLEVRKLSKLQRRTRSGAKIIRVVDGSAGLQAGFQVGDILTRIGDREIQKPADVVSAMQFVRLGASVEIRFWRDGESRTTRFSAQ